MVGSDKNYKASRMDREFREIFPVSDIPSDIVWYVDGQLVRFSVVNFPNIQYWTKPRCLLFSL